MGVSGRVGVSGWVLVGGCYRMSESVLFEVLERMQHRIDGV